MRMSCVCLIFLTRDSNGSRDDYIYIRISVNINFCEVL